MNELEVSEVGGQPQQLPSPMTTQVTEQDAAPCRRVNGKRPENRIGGNGAGSQEVWSSRRMLEIDNPVPSVHQAVDHRVIIQCF